MFDEKNINDETCISIFLYNNEYYTCHCVYYYFIKKEMKSTEMNSMHKKYKTYVEMRV